MASARATATRCCPPESLFAGLSRQREPHASRSSSARARMRRRAAAVDEHRHEHVLVRAEGGDEVVVLEHEADAAAAQPRERAVVQAGRFAAFRKACRSSDGRAAP